MIMKKIPFNTYGIARELSREGITEADVHIAAGLPLAWVG
jgi:plasmid segregation protein ParM